MAGWSSRRYVKDSIHGHISFDDHIWAFIDTPEFQRLRNLKCLGTAVFVFPNATHTRFEHSLGVGYLAMKLVRKFQAEQPELVISDSDVKVVTLAGLCHDLGHGCFSHVWDHEIVPRLSRTMDFHHERASHMMFDALCRNNPVEIEEHEREFVKALITGDLSDRRRSSKPFLFDIVANKRNSIDVDKWDYFLRDSYNLGISCGFSSDRLMKFSRVIDDEICFLRKESYDVYEMFHTRYSLFKRIYTHPTSKAVELMIVDAIVQAEPVLKLRECISDPKKYLRLTDTILERIEFSSEPELQPARDIVERVRRRDLYRKAGQALFSDGFPKERITAAEISSFSSELDEEDVIVDASRTNYSMGPNNPVEHTRFFSKEDPNVSFKVDKNDVSHLIPNKYEEQTVRVSVRQRSKVRACEKAFDQCLRKYGLKGQEDASDWRE